MGLVGSTVGLGVGYLLALGLRWLFGVFGLDLSRADFPMTWSAVIWSYVIGVGVTAVAALFPARRASRIAPIEALRDDVALPESTMRRRVLIGTVLVVVGAGLHRLRPQRGRQRGPARPSAAASCSSSSACT